MTTKTAETAIPSLEVAALETERLPLSEVTPHKSNPNIHSEEQIQAIMESLRLDGYIAGTMGIQKSTRRLYKGHGVYMALTGLAVAIIPNIIMEMADLKTLCSIVKKHTDAILEC